MVQMMAPTLGSEKALCISSIRVWMERCREEPGGIGVYKTLVGKPVLEERYGAVDAVWDVLVHAGGGRDQSYGCARFQRGWDDGFHCRC